MFTTEQIVRHEAGHAVVARKLGRPVKAIVWRERRNGDVQGDVDLGFTAGDDDRITILAAGLAADYLNSRMRRIDSEDDPLIPTFDDMVDWEREWFSSLIARVIADADLIAIRHIRNEENHDRTRDASIADAPPENVQRAIDILNEEWDLLCELVMYALPRRPGVGPRELRRFFAGKRPSRLSRLLDKPRVFLAGLQQRKFTG